jgi:hypothetical protein
MVRNFAVRSVKTVYLAHSSFMQLYMKKSYYLLVTALLAGCTKMPHITVTGKAPGLTNAVYIVTDSAGNNVMGDNINADTFKKDTVLQNKGYGTLTINRNGNESKNDFEVYLEPGTYNIELDTAHLDRYPKINSSSQTQNEVAAYHGLVDQASANAEMQVSQLQKRIKNFKAYMGSNADYEALHTQLKVATANVSKEKLKAFKKFLQQYPNSVFAARAMERLDYTDDPVAYNEIYKNLGPAAKNTDEGKLIGERLGKLMHVLPGAQAPQIAGTTPDGQAFDPAKLNKQIYIIDFWRAANEVSRYNHQDMINLLKNFDSKKVGCISVSLDSKRDWWTKAIADDKLTWPQYADLKGDDSPNAANWVITTIPTIYLVDGRWRIIKRNVPFHQLNAAIKEALKN